MNLSDTLVDVCLCLRRHNVPKETRPTKILLGAAYAIVDGLDRIATLSPIRTRHAITTFTTSFTTASLEKRSILLMICHQDVRLREGRLQCCILTKIEAQVDLGV